MRKKWKSKEKTGKTINYYLSGDNKKKNMSWGDLSCILCLFFVTTFASLH